MIGLIVLMLVVALITGAGRWATDRRMKRKYQEQYKDCCGTDCGCHDKQGEVK
tara:strand:- start:416 stop:574 length:159 start_codon:yes stop_codon:yes gene_type:complete